MLCAHDLDKEEARDFAMKDILEWDSSSRPEAAVHP